MSFPSTLVLGGQRSGKSAFAEGLLDADAPAVYIATCEVRDKEMQARVAAHIARRAPSWQTFDAPVQLVETLNKHATDMPVMIDSIGMWVSNLLFAGRDIPAEAEGLAQWLEARGPDAPGVVMVSDETGLGVVPDNQLAIDFVDALGQVNQRLARASRKVVLIAAGLPLVLKENTAQ